MPRPGRVRNACSTRAPSVYNVDGFLIEAYNHVDDLPRLSQTPRKRPRHATRGAAAAERRAEIANASDTQPFKSHTSRSARLNAPRSTSPASSLAADDVPTNSSPNPTCRVCLRASSPLTIIRCSDCKKAVHSFCLNPPAMALPIATTWKCELCVREPLSFKKETRLILRSALSDCPILCSSKYVQTVTDAVHVVSQSILPKSEKIDTDAPEAKPGTQIPADPASTDHTVILKIADVDSDFEDIDDDETVLESTPTPAPLIPELTLTKCAIKLPMEVEIDSPPETGESSNPQLDLGNATRQNSSREDSPTLPRTRDAQVKKYLTAGPGGKQDHLRKSFKSTRTKSTHTLSGTDGQQTKANNTSSNDKQSGSSKDDAEISIAEEFRSSLNRRRARTRAKRIGKSKPLGDSDRKKTFSPVSDIVASVSENPSAVPEVKPKKFNEDERSDSVRESNGSDKSLRNTAHLTRTTNVPKNGSVAVVGGKTGEEVRQVSSDDQIMKTGPRCLLDIVRPAPKSALEAEDVSPQLPSHHIVPGASRGTMQISPKHNEDYPSAHDPSMVTKQINTRSSLSANDDGEQLRMVTNRPNARKSYLHPSNLHNGIIIDETSEDRRNASMKNSFNTMENNTTARRQASQSWNNIHLDPKREALFTLAMGQKGSRPKRQDLPGRVGTSLDNETFLRTLKGNRADNVPESERKRMQATAMVTSNRDPHVGNQSISDGRIPASVKASINSLLQHPDSVSSQEGSDRKRRCPNPCDSDGSQAPMKFEYSAPFVSGPGLQSGANYHLNDDILAGSGNNVSHARLPIVPNSSHNSWGDRHSSGQVSPGVAEGYRSRSIVIRSESELGIREGSRGPPLSMKRTKKRLTMAQAPESLPNRFSPTPGARNPQIVVHSDTLSYRGKGGSLSSQFSHPEMIADVEKSDRTKEQWSQKFDTAHKSYSQVPRYSSEFRSDYNTNLAAHNGSTFIDPVSRLGEESRRHSSLTSPSQLKDEYRFSRSHGRLTVPLRDYSVEHSRGQLYRESNDYGTSDMTHSFRGGDEGLFTPTGELRRLTSKRNDYLQGMGAEQSIYASGEDRFREPAYELVHERRDTGLREPSLLHKAPSWSEYSDYGGDSYSLKATRPGTLEVVRKMRKSRPTIPQSGSSVRRAQYEQGRALMTVGGAVSGDEYGQPTSDDNRQGTQQYQFERRYPGSVYRHLGNSEEFSDPRRSFDMGSLGGSRSYHEANSNSHGLPMLPQAYKSDGLQQHQSRSDIPDLGGGIRHGMEEPPILSKTLIPDHSQTGRTVYHFRPAGDSAVNITRGSHREVMAPSNSDSTNLRRLTRSFTPSHQLQVFRRDAPGSCNPGPRADNSEDMAAQNASTPARTVPSLRNLLS